MKHKNLTLLFLLFIFSLARAQNVKVVRDVLLRSGLSAEKEVVKNLDVEIKSAVEFQKNISMLGSWFVDGAVGYKPWKFIKAEIDYRYTRHRDYFDSEFETANRIGGHLEGRADIKNVRLYLRARYQTIDDDFAFYEAQEPGKDILKARLKGRYKFNEWPFSTFAATELYIGGKQVYELYRWKNVVGVDYKLSKLNTLQLYYKMEKELNNDYPYFYSTIGLNLAFTL